MSKNHSLKDISELLSLNGVIPTHHRLVVLKYLMEKKNHPSVETIYKELVEEIPTLSKTTVYNTLKLLSDKNVISALSINTSEIIYDYIAKPHAHFQCIECEKVIDIDIPEQLFEHSNVDGHMILDTQINYKGKCSECK